MAMPDQAVLDCPARTKKAAFAIAVDVLHDAFGVDVDACSRALWRREHAASTAVGEGMAVPHARVPFIAVPRMVYLRLLSAIEFGAADGKPVSQVLFVLVPAAGAPEDHLALLAHVARVFSDGRSRDRLRAATDLDELRRVFAAAA